MQALKLVLFSEFLFQECVLMRQREAETLLPHFETQNWEVSSFDFCFRNISKVDSLLSHTVSLHEALVF